jgi:hypothetical protein
MSVGGSGARVQVFKQQTDAVLSQANPVSTTLYEVLPTTKNVEVFTIAGKITGGTVSELKIVVTVDGQSISYIQANPVSGNVYMPIISVDAADDAQGMTNAGHFIYTLLAAMRSGGRSVRIQVSCTWTVQPTPLVCRVKYAKIP